MSQSIANASSKPLSIITELFKLETVVKNKDKQTADKAFGSVDKKEPIGNAAGQPFNFDGVESGKRLKLNQDSVDLALNDYLVGSSIVT